MWGLQQPNRQFDTQHGNGTPTTLIGGHNYLLAIHLYILNGIHHTAPFTCTTSRGQSVVDYILSNINTLHTHTDADVTSGLSDHALLTTHVPFYSFD
jgi:hypothetical protein